MKTIMITGSLGYIGSVLTHYLLEKMFDYRLLLVDKMAYESDRDFFYTLAKDPRVTFIKADIGNQKLMASLMKECDAVVNLAALVGEPLCKSKPEEAIQVNEVGAITLAEMAMRRAAKFIQLSTASNYGQSPTRPAKEDDKLYPESLYAITKVRAEEWISNNIPNSIILRCATAYGMSPRTRFDILPNEWIRDALVQKEIRIFSPLVHRPVVHVQDIAQAIFLALDAPAERESRIFNVGSNEQNFTKGQIANMVGKHMNVPVTEIEGRIDPRDYMVDFNKIAIQLGFKCKYTVDQGIEEIMDAIDTEAITDDELNNNVNVLAVKH